MKDTEITGYMKLRLWVEADGHDDMDMFVNIRKLDDEGKYLPISSWAPTHPGAWGQMRVSHRELDPETLYRLPARAGPPEGRETETR